MKRFSVLIITLISCLSFSAYSCDESCKREKAEAALKSKFPSYLTWQYCETLKLDFMTADMTALQSYSTKHFNTKYKGPIKNIVKLINMRKSWLSECDNYISHTRDERLFQDEKTTNNVFYRMDSVEKELTAIIQGATYSSSQGDETKKIVAEKFESLYKVVDDHKNLMHLRGKYVYQ